jgi:hypothetical protein
LSGEKSYFYALHARIQNISVKLGPEKVHRGAKISGKQFCLKRLHTFAKPISVATFSLFVNNERIQEIALRRLFYCSILLLQKVFNLLWGC